jgi:hypothetical protein
MIGVSQLNTRRPLPWGVLDVGMLRVGTRSSSLDETAAGDGRSGELRCPMEQKKKRIACRDIRLPVDGSHATFQCRAFPSQHPNTPTTHS